MVESPPPADPSATHADLQRFLSGHPVTRATEPADPSPLLERMLDATTDHGRLGAFRSAFPFVPERASVNGGFLVMLSATPVQSTAAIVSLTSPYRTWPVSVVGEWSSATPSESAQWLLLMGRREGSFFRGYALVESASWKVVVLADAEVLSAAPRGDTESFVVVTRGGAVIVSPEGARPLSPNSGAACSAPDGSVVAVCSQGACELFEAERPTRRVELKPSTISSCAVTPAGDVVGFGERLVASATSSRWRMVATSPVFLGHTPGGIAWLNAPGTPTARVVVHDGNAARNLVSLPGASGGRCDAAGCRLVTVGGVVAVASDGTTATIPMKNEQIEALAECSDGLYVATRTALWRIRPERAERAEIVQRHSLAANRSHIVECGTSPPSVVPPLGKPAPGRIRRLKKAGSVDGPMLLPSENGTSAPSGIDSDWSDLDGFETVQFLSDGKFVGCSTDGSEHIALRGMDERLVLNTNGCASIRQIGDIFAVVTSPEGAVSGRSLFLNSNLDVIARLELRGNGAWRICLNNGPCSGVDRFAGEVEELYAEYAPAGDYGNDDARYFISAHLVSKRRSEPSEVGK